MKIIRLVLTIIHLAIFFALSAMLLNSIVPPKVFKWFNFISLAFPPLIITYIVLTIIWIASWKKRAIVFLIGLLLFFNPIRRWVNYSPNNKQGNLKLITYNIHSGNDVPTLKAFIEGETPDILFIQEKGYHNKESLTFSGLKNVTEERVISIYSRYPIKKSGEIINDSSNGHSLYADIDVNGKMIRFINIYLEPFYLKKDMLRPTRDNKINEEKARILGSRMAESFRIHQDQVAEIRSFITDSPYPVIIGGDFNSVPSSYEYYHLSKNLNDAFMDAGSGSATSFHDYKFPIRIDYLFSSPEIKATSYTVKRDLKISDHFPVISSFKIK
ncbi:endonuclease/exonuclease/phosphatase family protein [Elizabethkingia meningoseptica]|uniref:endonuclease/exonuclease/phosphatase family protein n=1 Tax=Elizabethkingia meningoseptica TaxID=238 RepID=UPI0023AED42A|nr:endonuclease/exonuclease/phosphatase family protein [Elizabethkingia meningoseptica]MDE5438108.1 endonuclease/exonuclease/phosphatase family protein [Elizabethkingia meningoseptica]MDE5508651.1 endonuclease/exonuclease/phosphatase family protein [Elizabethkingia meningoseptica]MDE5515890.1 endonuclease/exonuclease/phosphatase family protein [Elizabethkingia meningoseptica]MDE5527034.1 endonuclease/exonuclease/phosphatase family protein [Elizabethkingia meningoseptica]MDE5530306.1 endonuclea